MGNPSVPLRLRFYARIYPEPVHVPFWRPPPQFQGHMLEFNGTALNSQAAGTGVAFHSRKTRSAKTWIHRSSFAATLKVCGTTMAHQRTNGQAISHPPSPWSSWCATKCGAQQNEGLGEGLIRSANPPLNGLGVSSPWRLGTMPAQVVPTVLTK